MPAESLRDEWSARQERQRIVAGNRAERIVALIHDWGRGVHRAKLFGSIPGFA